MNIKFKSFLIILVVLIASCNNQNKENELPNSENNAIFEKENQEPEIEKAKIDKPKIIDQLQGKWKEHEYPYRTAEFVRSTVKFVEEGTDSNPKFEKFEVSVDCPKTRNNRNGIDLQSTVFPHLYFAG